MSRPIELFSPSAALCHETPAEASSQAKNSSSNWKKELAAATTSVSSLLKQLKLEHALKIIDLQPDFKCLVTESFINKIEAGNINDPLLQQILPLNDENNAIMQHQGVSDPVGDIQAMATPGLLHKYHGRSLLISTGACAVHCRYCFRRHYPYQQFSSSPRSQTETLAYLKKNSDIEEIILSGGDPLILDNKRLGQLIDKLESVPHLQTLRIHTRLPVVLPDRIDDGLLQILRQTRFQVVLVTHINHANEIQQIEKDKFLLLHKAGIILFNQSVLLKGINDSSAELINLSKQLFDSKIIPYYLHMLDPVKGAMHFSVDKNTAIQLYKEAEQKLPGYLLPKMVQDIEGNKSKTAIFSI